MGHDVPADVRDVLTQLHEAAVEAAVAAAGEDDASDASADGTDETATSGGDDTAVGNEDGTTAGDTGDTAEDAPESFAAPLETARTVAGNKLPTGELRSQFTHGYDRALAVAAAEPAVAAEYVRAVDRRLAAATDRDHEGVAGDGPTDGGDDSGASDDPDDPDEDL